MGDLTRDGLMAGIDAPLQYYESVESTNPLALNWLKDGVSAGAVVIADEQRLGRGRLGRHWQTPPGTALAMSFVLRPTPDTAGRVTMLGAVAVAETCEHFGVTDIGIKWANDVQVQGKKICGILPEAVWEQSRLLGVILGIGVNIRTTFSGELAQTAGSIEALSGQVIDRNAFAITLYHRVMHWYGRMRSPELFDNWRQRLTTIGQQVQVGDVAGQAVDVDESGALLIRTDSGQTQRVIAGDVLIT